MVTLRGSSLLITPVLGAIMAMQSVHMSRQVGSSAALSLRNRVRR